MSPQLLQVMRKCEKIRSLHEIRFLKIISALILHLFFCILVTFLIRYFQKDGGNEKFSACSQDELFNRERFLWKFRKAIVN